MVQYIDYLWELDPTTLKIDRELDVDRLGWKAGDLFRLINVDGQVSLIKIDPIEKFVRGFSNETI